MTSYVQMKSKDKDFRNSTDWADEGKLNIDKVTPELAA